ncbi:TetR/AcrR family transcriptional regulator [Vallitalea guaymasensis]|uniref:TetR/AcrR family transcriptional regulator n=1 Tax=Vallitalea guaymasensis TaxID=1185412 RepID=A0A8J8SCZ9_9FIRM|nr:TetR/AcrR family transcriptional regulator [Vallitalea guaymasensis]QUH30383.1 TetR/AcrR family transcriptional regulator [Vallitalea guaymasensis]
MKKFSDNPKEEILSAAKEIALKEGISAINIRSVAKKCNISIGTVYNSFPTKNDLLFSVVEDFWENAFIDINKCITMEKGFIEKIEDIYNNLFQYLDQFQENWLEQLSLLKSCDKSFGRKREHDFFAKIQTILVKMLAEEKTIKSSIWTDVFTKERLSVFIFDCMLDMLRRKEQDLQFFVETLNRILYI